MGCMGEPDGPGMKCIFFASDESSYRTDSELVMDSGFTAA